MIIHRSVNCVQNDQGAWCKDRRVRRSLFGVGARCCAVFENKPCPFQVKHSRPLPPPAPPRRKAV